MEWEVLDVVGELDSTDDQLYNWVYKECQLLPMLTQCHDPKSETIEELPCVNIFHSFGSHVVSNVTKMQTQLTNVEETELVCFG